MALTNLVTLIHWYPHLISLEIVVGYWKLRTFQKTQVNWSGLPEKLGLTYPSWNSQYGISRAKLRNKDLLPCWKYFVSVGTTNFFQHSLGIKFLCDRVENFLIYWQGKHNLGPGRQFQQNWTQGKPLGHISPGHLDRVYVSPFVFVSPYWKLFSLNFWKISRNLPIKESDLGNIADLFRKAASAVLHQMKTEGFNLKLPS